ARGEIRDVLVPLHHRDHRVEFVRPRGLDRQMELGRHRSPPMRGCTYYYASLHKSREQSASLGTHVRSPELSSARAIACAGLIASALPIMSASIFRAREAGTRAFMMRFSRPGIILDRFSRSALRPSDTHCSTLIGFIGMVCESKPNFSSTSVFVNPAAST